MGRKKKGGDFEDLPDPNEEAALAGEEAVVPAAATKPKGGKKGKKGGKAAAAFPGGCLS